MAHLRNYSTVGRIEGIIEVATDGQSIDSIIDSIEVGIFNESVRYRIAELFHSLDNDFLVKVFSMTDGEAMVDHGISLEVLRMCAEL